MLSSVNEIELIDGTAVSMGDGVFVVIQDGPKGPMDVVLTRADLNALIAADDATMSVGALGTRVEPQKGREVLAA